MIEWMTQKFLPAKARDDQLEREKIARLEVAERRLRDLQDRSERAIKVLSERQDRNHWREAIERMIQGVM